MKHSNNLISGLKEKNFHANNSSLQISNYFGKRRKRAPAVVVTGGDTKGGKTWGNLRKRARAPAIGIGKDGWRKWWKRCHLCTVSTEAVHMSHQKDREDALSNVWRFDQLRIDIIKVELVTFSPHSDKLKTPKNWELVCWFCLCVLPQGEVGKGRVYMISHFTG